MRKYAESTKIEEISFGLRITINESCAMSGKKLFYYFINLKTM